jgi:hypothetical protein
LKPILLRQVDLDDPDTLRIEFVDVEVGKSARFSTFLRLGELVEGRDFWR